MATNAIGTGAVVLTANADRLLAGLDRAEQATTKTAERIAQRATAAGKKSGSGLLGSVIFGVAAGSAAGGAAGAAIAAVGAASAGIGKLLDRITEVGERAKQYSGIDTQRYQHIDRAQKGFDRISAAADDFFFRVAEKLGPTIEKAASALEVLSFVGAEAFGEVLNLVGQVVEEISHWIDETFGLATATTSAGDQTLAVLRGIGKGTAYIVEAAGVAVTALLKLFEDVAGGAARLLRGVGLNDLAGDAEAAARSIGRVASTLESQIGTSVVGFDKWFDGVEKRYQNVQRIAKQTAVQLTGAALGGTNDSYSILARNQAANILNGKTNPDANPVVRAVKDQTKEIREVKRAIIKLVDRSERSIPIEIVP